MNDRRTAPRYELTLFIVIRLPVEQEAVSRTGRTQNLSTRGVYFTTGNDLIPDTELELTMTLPAEVIGSSGAFIRATGKVIRVDKRSWVDDQTIGVAAVMELHEIVRNEAAIA